MRLARFRQQSKLETYIFYVISVKILKNREISLKKRNKRVLNKFRNLQFETFLVGKDDGLRGRHFKSNQHITISAEVIIRLVPGGGNSFIQAREIFVPQSSLRNMIGCSIYEGSGRRAKQ